MNLKQLADLKIKKADNNNVLFYADGVTEDIIKTILTGHKKSAGNTYLFAKHLKGKNKQQTCYNIWRFIRSNIQYQIDPPGQQFVKSPSRLWETKIGDCKSFSLFAASILQNLNIPYGFRFVSYSGVKRYTHVYIIVPNTNYKNYITLDAVLKTFNKEKKKRYSLTVTYL